MGRWTGIVFLVLVVESIIVDRVDGARLEWLSQAEPSQEAIERGRQSFIISCAFCHGTDARGGESGPDLVRSEMMLDDNEGDLLGPFLAVGRPDQGMPPFQLSENEVRDLAGFVRAQTQAVINRRSYEIQNVATGDAEAGRAYFNGEGGCSGCHSPTGDLAGIADRYEPPDLLARIVYPGRGGRGAPPPRPRRVTVSMPDGATLEGTLEYVDDFSVAFRDSEGHYHSLSRSDANVTIRDPYRAHVELLGRYTDDNLHDLVTYLVTLR